mmetsp:Transcript_22015/g.47408  ORF Transcript_22015/g.47408 Transcript_22015/m.47408 type:complete len:144 (-) Transcript_22015:261-692(-)|eukprot:CAMPEP_0183357096 /NCGR_PEP_ID=MMETSP0164_2-20130417/45378_1 /TAXON_ID=221442 /ORGANISM="Coccolithus pelagicus ssp braarudi, Strain PLY182g" /LENGTH=143 /DNA_ID=CAMNT_0025530651 /DNA_START=255 /DNA_END=686 /DNA_ORIENTATION=+
MGYTDQSCTAAALHSRLLSRDARSRFSLVFGDALHRTHRIPREAPLLQYDERVRKYREGMPRAREGADTEGHLACVTPPAETQLLLAGEDVTPARTPADRANIAHDGRMHTLGSLEHLICIQKPDTPELPRSDGQHFILDDHL